MNFKIKKSFAIFVFMLFLSASGWSQQVLEKNGYTVSIATNEYNYFPSMGGSYIGVIKVIDSNSVQKNYGFTLIIMKDSTISHLAIKNVDFSETLLPRLYYDDSTTSFVYNRGEKNEVRGAVESNASHEMIILSGMLIWLEQNNNSLLSTEPEK